jgi:adenylate cyclase
MSADPENEYFSDGITEELLNTLTRVEGLQVTSRTSAFAFKGKNHDIRDIAIQLNVDKVLEGSVRKAGNRVRITAQLINAMDGYHIWSENYDRNLDDIFEVQDEISGIIANKLRENLTQKQKEEPLVKPAPANVTAYTYYLKGLHFWNKLTPADCRKAIECFEKCIAIDPGYAQAYAMSAAVYSYLGATGQMLGSKAFEIVERYADKALQLDSTIAESHIAKATVYLLYEWKWKEAYEYLQKAVRLNPGAVAAYELLGMYYIVMGQKEKALQTLEEAERMDPLSPGVIKSLASIYIFNDRYDEAMAQADKLLEINPTMRIAIEMKGWCTGMKGDWEGALVFFEEFQRLTNHPLKGWMGAGFAYAKLNRTKDALEVIRKMEQRQQEEPGAVLDADIAGVWFALGDYDKTFYHLNQCIDKRMGPVSYFLEYPLYRDLKKDPRFEALKKRMNV